MIDTHAHILPAMDDGATDLSQALAFARQAVAEGVTTICATPHTCDGVHNCGKAEILSACAALASQFLDHEIPIRLLPGAEIRVTHDLLRQYDDEKLLSFNDAYRALLIELPDMFIAKAMCMTIRQLTDRGVTPIIAHAERNPMLLHAPDLIDEFYSWGARIQITAGSLTGDYGPPIMKAAKAMVKRSQVFCLGSDIHPGRKYRISAARKLITKWAGKQAAHQITNENPKILLGCFDFPTAREGKAY